MDNIKKALKALSEFFSSNNNNNSKKNRQPMLQPVYVRNK